MPSPINVHFWRFWLALLCVCCCKPSAADDAVLLDPSTTIVTVDGVQLSAGLILVPVGKDFQKWWAGEGHDSETQQRVRKALATYSEAAIDTELLRAMLSNIFERGGSAKAEEFRPTREKYMPIALSELHQKYSIDEWSQQSPDAENYISTWLTSRAEAELLSLSMAQVLLEKTDHTAIVRAHWAAHRDDYRVLRKARWRQITVLKGQATEVERLLLSQKEFEEVAKAKSLDRYRQEGGLVESEAPHLFIEDHIITAIKGNPAGKMLRLNVGEQVIFVKAETVDVVQCEFHEVSKQVRIDLARLMSSDLAKSIAAKRRAKSRIEWETSISN